MNPGPVGPGLLVVGPSHLPAGVGAVAIGSPGFLSEPGAGLIEVEGARRSVAEPDPLPWGWDVALAVFP